MLEGFWYIGAGSRDVRSDRPMAVSLLNQPLVLFRDQFQKVHALEDRCPHRGMALSPGWQKGASIRCRFHGWRFAASGECLEVPALANGTVPQSACVRPYPVEERDGWVWVYMGNDLCPKPTTPPPALPVPPDGSRMVSARMSVSVKVRFDFAVDSLVDPAHVPWVHNRFFRQKRVVRLKEKEFTRLPLGFRTVSENVELPNTFVFRALTPGLARARSAVEFVLPGIHFETHEVGTRFASVMLVATPLTTETTRLDITVGWNFLRWLPVAWLVRLTMRTTMAQDRGVLEPQERGNREKTTMILSQEADTLSVWYRRLQKYHLDQLAGLPNVVHPVPERATLRWRT